MIEFIGSVTVGGWVAIALLVVGKEALQPILEAHHASLPGAGSSVGSCRWAERIRAMVRTGSR